jgi:cysteine desulfurase
MRSGTEGLASIVGLSVAIQNATSHIQEDLKHVDTLRHFMAEKLLEKIPNIDIITPLDKSLYTVLSVGFPSSMSHDMLPFQLDMKGVACSSGSACSSGANKGSHVLEAINYPKDRKVIRFSFSKYNTKDEIEYAVNQIEGLYMEMHQKMSQ